MRYEITRREFLKLTGCGAACLALGRLRWTGVSRAEAAFSDPVPPYAGWADLYRQKFEWDRRVRCTHIVNCWYQRNCAWTVFVKDGVVLREEQAGVYPAVAAEIPDFNPRGCQKGACYSALMYAPDRLRYPLRRVGRRGSGQWKRVSWDEALSEVADKLLDAVTEAGPDSVVLEPGGSLASATWRVAVERLVKMLDGLELDTNTELDDGQAGAAVTFGTPVSSRSADDFFYSDVILVWGANPTYTQIPNAHFFNEARYNGTRVVTVAPDYSASAIHSDLFVPVRPGTDAALALAAAQVMLERYSRGEGGGVDTEFIRAQSDLPFLVRADGRFLRAADIEEGGRSDVFYAYDENSAAIVAAPTSGLDWDGAKPALTGSYEVETLTGKVTVRPVIDILRERLNAEYTPEKASRICGTSPQLIRNFAELLVGARSVAGVAGSCIPKLYHGDLIMRAQILLFVLGGHLGRPGAGYDTTPFLWLDGLDKVGASQMEGLATKLKLAPTYLKRRFQGETAERIIYDFFRDYMKDGNIVSSVLYWRHHGGMQERTDQDWGRNLPRSVEDYLGESYAKGWQKQPPPAAPKVLLIAGSNLLRRLRSSDLLLKKLWPKIDLIVDTDIRMSTTCLHSDILLPGAGSYEKDDATNWLTLLSPYAHITQAAVEPVGDSKPEWEIHARLAEWIEKRARARGLAGFRDRDGNEQRLDDFHRRFTFDGRFGNGAQSEVAQEVVRKTEFIDSSFDQLRENGFERVTGIGSHPFNIGNATDVHADAPVINRSRRRDRPGPWPTLTRRIQFYIDHPLYLELGEQLPAHKEPPQPGGDHPLILTGGHTRWSIHAGWRNLNLLLQLQRGEAAAFIADADAAARGIADGDNIRLWNDVGEFRIRAKVAAAVRPGTVIVYHAWEDYQFGGATGYRNVLPSPLNPIELAGGYNHLRPVPASLQPGQSDRETRIDMEKV